MFNEAKYGHRITLGEHDWKEASEMAEMLGVSRTEVIRVAMVIGFGVLREVPEAYDHHRRQGRDAVAEVG